MIRFGLLFTALFAVAVWWGGHWLFVLTFASLAIFYGVAGVLHWLRVRLGQR